MNGSGLGTSPLNGLFRASVTSDVILLKSMEAKRGHAKRDAFAPSGRMQHYITFVGPVKYYLSLLRCDWQT